MGLVIVLVLLALGGLIMVPLLTHLYTGVSSDRIYRERMELNYAADAGVEDGIWKAENEQVPLDPYDYVSVYSYSLPEALNGKDVSVSIKQVWPLDGLESDVNGTTPASPPLSITSGVIDQLGDFEIRLSYDTPEVELLIDCVAVWLPPEFAYVNNSSSSITEENPIQTDWNGGTVLTWDFGPPVNFDDLPQATSGEAGEGGMQPAIELPSVRVLSFSVTPEGELARGSYSWIRTTNADNYLCWDTNFTLYEINATASDNATGRSMGAEGYTYVSEGFDTGWLDLGETLMTGDYRAVGNTMMQDLNLDRRRETVLDESSATINDIPGDANVVYGLLYWSGWKDSTGSMEPDKQVTFKIEAALDLLRPSAAGNYTECEPVGAINNYQCTDEATSDEDTTHVQTGFEPEILRPNGNGTVIQCDNGGDWPNFECVDEGTSDENSTYVETRGGATEIDTYNLQNHTQGSGTISSVTIHARSRADAEYYDMAAQTVIRTHGINYFGTYTTLPKDWSDENWVDLSTTYNTNPNTGSPWTLDEVNALEAGVRHYDLGSGTVRTTQVYVSVDYYQADSMNTVLRPSAAGDETNISYQYPSSGAHWDKVDEANADNFTTYVKAEGTPITNWWDQDWQYRREITIDHTKVEDVSNPSTTYADFPVLVYATGLSGIKANGADIRFTASDGVTELPREIEYYAGGTLYAWVKVTLTKDSGDSSDDEFYMYYGNPAATEPAPDSTYGSENVWASNFTAVWHLEETSGTIEDSTAKAKDGTYSGSDWDPANTKIDGALGFDGYNDEVDMGNEYNSDLDMYGKSFTWECWYDTDSFASGTWARLIAMRHDYNDYYQFVGDGDNDKVQFYSQKGGNVYGYAMSSPPSGWVHIAATFNNSTNQIIFYVNAAPRTDSVGNCGDGDDTHFRLGRRQDNSGLYDGVLDEVRISSTVRSADWIATEYTNQNAPANFCLLGGEESSDATQYERDLYNIADHTSESGNIGKVIVYFSLSGDESGGQDYTGYAKAAIKTHGAVYVGSEESRTGQTFATKSYTWTNNPATGSAWTWSEIDALQAGVELKGVLGTYGYCTQVYVKVYYGPIDVEDIDTYQLSDLEELRDAVSSVTIYTETKGTMSADTHTAQTVIRTHGVDFYGDNTTLPLSYTTVNTTYSTNPSTGSAWTLDEINALEAGVKHYDNGNGSVRTTQVYVGISYDILVEEVITAEKWWLMENQAPDYAYSCFKNVTSIVSSAAPTGNAKYTVGGVYGDTGSELSYAGWSLIIIYSSPSELGTQFYLYEDLTFAGTNASGTFTVDGFLAPSDAEVTLTCFVGEGDDWYDNDSLLFNDNYLSDDTNPWDDVWNGKSSSLQGEQIDGIDLDSFDVSAPIINSGDTSANMTYSTQQDNWNLIYHILAFRTDQGILSPSSTGVFSWD